MFVEGSQGNPAWSGLPGGVPVHSALQGHVVGSLFACCPWTGMLGELQVQVDGAGLCTDKQQVSRLLALHP